MEWVCGQAVNVWLICLHTIIEINMNSFSIGLWLLCHVFFEEKHETSSSEIWIVVSFSKWRKQFERTICLNPSSFKFSRIFYYYVILMYTCLYNPIIVFILHKELCFSFVETKTKNQEGSCLFEKVCLHFNNVNIFHLICSLCAI